MVYSVVKLVSMIVMAIGAVVGIAMGIRSAVEHKSTPPGSGDPPSGCSQSYTTVADDSCTSIAQKFGISVAQFRSLNPSLPSNCTILHIGTPCCVKSNGTESSGADSSGDQSSGNQSSGCSQSYTTGANDSCTSIAQKFGLSVDQFLSLNPTVSTDCPNLHIGTTCCVGSSGADSSSSGDESSGDESSGNQSSGDQSSGCSQSYTAVTGDSCTSIAQNFGISVDEFLSLNPNVSPDCTNLHVGTAYCV